MRRIAPASVVVDVEFFHLLFFSSLSLSSSLTLRTASMTKSSLEHQSHAPRSEPCGWIGEKRLGKGRMS